MNSISKRIFYISDDANWVIKEIGQSLKSALAAEPFFLTKNDYFKLFCIRHYSTRYAINRFFFRRPFTKVIFTYFHGDDADIEILTAFKKNQNNIDVIHTSCEITKQHLIRNGINEKKIIIVPIGIDVNQFNVVSKQRKKEIRLELEIPQDATVIGSFQKDGNGWGEGLEPKLCKGPDLFCDTVELIHKEKPLFVLLTGPSRGYVKKRLEKANIPFKHIYLEDYKKITDCFNALDLYLVTARLEGGPRAPMECMASGVPIISTKVGQTPEVIDHGENGYLTDIGDNEKMKDYALEVLNNSELQEKFIKSGLEKVKRYDFGVISNEYIEKLYKPLC